MRVLLDTHILIWAMIELEKMPPTYEHILYERSNEFFFSSVDIWEAAIKRALGRPSFEIEPSSLLAAARAAGLRELAVTSAAAVHVRSLPHYRRDPFDRMLVAQAIDGGLTLLTDDGVLAAYGDSNLYLR